MRSTLFALALVGCGDTGSVSSIDVKLAGTQVAAIRSGDTWKPVEKTATGDASIELDGPTMLAIVCDDPSFFNYWTLYLGPGIDDTEQLDLSCAPPAAGADVTVTIDAPETTDVAVGLRRTFGGGPIDLAPGTYDVIAVDRTMTPPRFEIRRGVALTTNTTLTFDLAATGTPMLATTITVTGAAAGETPQTLTSLRVGRTILSVSSIEEPAAWLFPAAALVEGDRQTVSAYSSDETRGSRSHRRLVAGTETAITLALPEHLTSATATTSSVTWQGGDWDGFYFGINSPSFDVLWDVSVFPEWTRAGGAVDTIRIPDPTSIPGWQSAWNLGATAGYEWYFTASRREDPDTFSASHGGEL